MNTKQYLKIVSHYESCLEKYGDTHLGVDWPKKEDVATRYQVMLELIKKDNYPKIELLDFGCGASHFYEYILEKKRSLECNCPEIEYSGLDISQKFISLSQRKFPTNKYYCLDILAREVTLPNFDYIVMNGVFTEKRELSFDQMFTYFQDVVSKVFKKTRIGMAFNVMSKEVDWERDDLFHLPFDLLASFLVNKISRNFVIRHNYGLYEYTTYVYK